MQLAEILRAEKTDVEWGDWKSGPVPRPQFPLSKTTSGKYSLGTKFRWRIGKFSIENQRFRVWIKLRTDLESYCALLGEERDGDMAVLAALEFHGTHPGWHVHAACGAEDDVTPGKLRDQKSYRRIPGRRRRHRRDVFGVTEENGVDKAASAFGMYRTKDTWL